MSEAAHGTMSAQRTSRRPGKLAFRNCPRPSEMTMVAATITATHSAVFASTVGRASCSRRRA